MSREDGESRASRPFRIYSRIAAVAFLLVGVYTLTAKVPSGEFRSDWLHTVLHLVTGAFAVFAGWLAARHGPALALTAGVGMGYGLLTLFGLVSDGLFLGTPLRIPLTTADNVFHAFLSATAVLTFISASR